ncbi:MAG: LysE family transporter [Syntrophales bacterium]
MLALGTVFVTSLLLAFSGAMMPGPLLTATISESARRGGLTGPLLILGHSILELGMVAALLFGLAPLLTSDAVFAAIALAGAVILFVMAAGMFRSLPSLRIDWEERRSNSGPLLSAGILLSLSNPYWTIWWATIGLGYLLTCRSLGIAGVAAFFFGHIAGDFIWYSAVSLLVSRGRRLLSERIYRGLIGLCASFLAGFACYFVYAGVRRLNG